MQSCDLFQDIFVFRIQVGDYILWELNEARDKKLMSHSNTIGVQVKINIRN